MDGALTGLADRRLSAVLQARLGEEPVVILNGPRTVGKSTLLTSLARATGSTVIDCDDPATRQAVRTDPSLFARSARPVLIDEYQHVPEILDAIKAELNRDLSPGRYVLAGSTSYATVPRAGTALTGRADILEVAPLTQVEIDGGVAAFVPDLLEGATSQRIAAVAAVTDRADYVRRVTSGGMPVALRRPPGRSRARWFANYVELVIERDVLELSRVRQRAVLPRLLHGLAARAGQVLNVRNLAQAVQVEPSTAENYLRLLEAVFLVRRLPAWGTTLASRVSRQPKIHCVDPGLAAFLLGLTPDTIATNDPSVLTEFGHLVETFAVGEILAQASWYDGPVRAGHYRTATGDEVDLVLERGDGQVFAFEVKAGSRIHETDLRGLRALRHRLGARLSAAVVLHTGPHAFTFEDGTAALPLDSLWTAPTT